MRPYVPTPRTDAEAIRFTEQFPTLPIYGVGLNFSRALERALCAVVAAQAPLIEKAIRDLAAGAIEVRNARNEVLRADTEARRASADAEKLRALLRDALPCVRSGLPTWPVTSGTYDRAVAERILAVFAKNPVGENDVDAGSVTARPEGCGSSSPTIESERPDSRDKPGETGNPNAVKSPCKCPDGECRWPCRDREFCRVGRRPK